MLTKADVEILRAPFKPKEIEFLRGYAYVREQAVNNRLSDVDPAWCMQITAWDYRSDAHVVVMGSMTLNEATRYGVGEQKNEGNPAKPLDAAKGAATDLLKRLARLFHVGLYLTELPDEVKSIEAYKTWYNKEMGITPQRQQTQQRPTSPQPSQPTPQPTTYTAPPSDAGDGDTKIYTCDRITVLPRKDGFQYIAHCDRKVNIVTYTREKYRAAFDMLVDGWNVEVTAKGKVIPCTPPIRLKARANGSNWELVEVLKD